MEGLPGEEDDFADVCFGKCDGLSLDVRSGPAMLDFADLVALSSLRGHRDGALYLLDGAPADLQGRLNTLLDQAFISNEAFKSGARPHRPEDPQLGPTIRALAWNIERGFELDAIIDAFGAADDGNARAHFFANRIAAGAPQAEISAQLDAMSGVDVVVLNEVDRMMKRSGYRDVVEELAGALDMNYAYAVEFVEVDPIAVGTQTFAREDFLTAQADGTPIDDGSITETSLAESVREAGEMSAVDPARSRNLHGNAVLSRYPILRARSFPLHTVCWDWNAGEWKPRSWIQDGKELLAEKLFLEKVAREVRHGGRTALVVDLLVPGLSAKGTSLELVPGGREGVLTVVSAHLEAKSTPGCRADQMAEVLSHLRDVANPVVLAGDLNTFGSDGRPTTVERMLMARFGNPAWVARKIITHYTPYAGWVFQVSDAINTFRIKDDPTGVNIPLLMPNAERGLFDAVEDFSFSDMARFDFRGDEDRTVNGTARTLANSNQRDAKGFKTTSALKRTGSIGGVTLFGRWKIDWMFVRGYQRSPRDKKATYRMSPHFPRALEELRDWTVDPATGESRRLSDHAAITTILPMRDTCRDGACTGDTVPEMEFGDIDWNDAYTDGGDL